MASVTTGLRWLCLLICFLVLIGEIDGRGGRGGGARGGRFGGSRSRYRSGVRSRSYRSGSRNWQWKAAAAAGAIYGYRSYSRRRMYYDSPDREPTICRNTVDYRMDNGTHYSMFICPKADQPEDWTYCCGPENQQRCCRFWDDGGRVFGVVFGLLLMVGIIGLIVYCCCCRKKKGSKEKNTGAQYAMTHNQPPMSDMTPSYPQQDQNGDQKAPYPPGPSPYPPQGDGNAPPYPSEGGYPPQGDSAYPPTSGPGYPPSSGPGYPPTSGPGDTPSGPGYPPSGPGYPPSGPGYPPSGPGYPPNQGGYPPNPGYPPSGPGYPPGPVGNDGQPPPYPVNPSDPAPSAPPPPYPAN